jgi:hypothetical protein
MKATDLRIGNYIDSELTDYSELRQEVLCDFANGYTHLKPIPLTEEWLVKFGYNNNTVYLRDLKVTATEDNDPIYYLADEYDNGVGCNDIQYVHQLQNLYFALTGKELTIKQ